MEPRRPPGPRPPYAALLGRFGAWAPLSRMKIGGRGGTRTHDLSRVKAVRAFQGAQLRSIRPAHERYPLNDNHQRPRDGRAMSGEAVIRRIEAP